MKLHLALKYLLLLPVFSLQSCYTFKLASKAQAGTDYGTEQTVHAYSLFWGALNKPQVIRPKNCDELNLPGVAEMKLKTNFANALITIATLGIYCPVQVSWRCSKSGNGEHEQL